jgi:hypothetical protein
MSPMLQRILIALGQRGVQTPLDQRLGLAYRALQYHQEHSANVYPHACDILLAELEGGATTVADIPQRLGDLVRLLEHLHRSEELEAWADEETRVIAA